MVRKILGACTLLLSFIMISCDKEEKDSNVIVVSDQWTIDQSGVIVSAPNDGQWTKKVFTASELNLFASLDTANLTGTSMPVTIREASNYPFPNPFRNQHSLAFRFNDNFSGAVILKYVVVDSRLNVIDRKVARLTATSGFATVMVAPMISTGQYRLYYTLSAQGNPHFFQSWGNIQKVN